jgi:DDE domain
VRVIPARVPQPDGRPHGGCSPRACCKCYWCAYAGCAGTPCRRNKAAAKKFFAQGAPELLKGCTYVPRVLITDKLASYGAAKREVLTSVEHRQSRYLNNRAENSHQPTRKRERGYPLGVAALQISWARPTLRPEGTRCLWADSGTLLSAPASTESTGVPRSTPGTLPSLERGDERAGGCIILLW